MNLKFFLDNMDFLGLWEKIYLEIVFIKENRIKNERDFINNKL